MLPLTLKKKMQKFIIYIHIYVPHIRHKKNGRVYRRTYYRDWGNYKP